MPLTTYTAGEVLTAASLNANLSFAATNPISKIVQVVQGTYATSTTTTSTSYVTTGLSLSITPTLNTSKVLILVTMPVQNTSNTSDSKFTIFRGTVAGTNLFGAVGSGIFYSEANGLNVVYASNFLDSPATTSATTYTVGMKVSAATTTAHAQVASATSSITLIEVLA
jgi:hypothetical protein